MSAAVIDDVHVDVDLSRKTARGALNSVIGQAANFALRILSMVTVARLVTPEHFGLVGMVTAFTGMLSLFRDAGLSSATVQRDAISEELVSALFWINVVIGVVLASVTVAAAPLLAAFYGDERLLWITIALASGFVFNGALAQHRALLQRRMRFGILSLLDVLSLIFSLILGVGMALEGLGYWALVAIAVSQPFISLIGVWCASGWTPTRPQRAVGVGSMLQYGGVVTLNSLVVYVAYNADKVLMGRFFGAEALGLYGRAYQLISLPTDNLNTTLGSVMFPALSRLQNDPPRMRRFFLSGYGLFLSIVTPVTVICALFADEIVRVLLGSQWGQAAPIFRVLAPTILALSLINPMGHFMQACGYAVRSLKVAFAIAPVVVLGYWLGLSHGPQGVAFGFSAAMLLLVVPVVYWARRGSLITMADIARTVTPPFVSSLTGAAAAIAVGQGLPTTSAFIRLATLALVLFFTHFIMLAFVFGHMAIYVDLLHKVFGSDRDAARVDRVD